MSLTNENLGKYQLLMDGPQVCSRCGAALAADASWCSSCGLARGDPEAAPIAAPRSASIRQMLSAWWGGLSRRRKNRT
jgi:predicted amidophosphoribosyltransferase